MKESNEELIDMFLYPTLKSMLRDILNKFDYMLRNKDIYLPEAIKDVEHDLELLFRLNRLEELEKENKELKEGLFEKFSECYEVNKWTPESGFDSQLDFYIHESWKREPVVDKLRKQVENLKCCGNCSMKNWGKESYVKNGKCCPNWFTRKPHNICWYWQSDTMTSEERK